MTAQYAMGLSRAHRLPIGLYRTPPGRAAIKTRTSRSSRGPARLLLTPSGGCPTWCPTSRRPPNRLRGYSVERARPFWYTRGLIQPGLPRGLRPAPRAGRNAVERALRVRPGGEIGCLPAAVGLRRQPCLAGAEWSADTCRGFLQRVTCARVAE